jgi:hypothetical protein
VTVDEILCACADKKPHEALRVLADYLEELTSAQELDRLRALGATGEVEHGRALGAVGRILAYVANECEKMARSAPRKARVPS